MSTLNYDASRKSKKKMQENGFIQYHSSILMSIDLKLAKNIRSNSTQQYTQSYLIHSNENTLIHRPDQPLPHYLLSV